MFSWISEPGSQVILDNLSDGIFVIQDGSLVYVNQGFADVLGYQISELIDRSFIELISTSEQTLIWERHRARLAGETVPDHYEIHLITAQGSLIFCSVNVKLIEYPPGYAVTVGSIRDITQQKAELVKLEAAKIELNSIFDDLPDVFYRTDMQGIITMISPSCFKVIGYHPEEMIGRALADFYMAPEDRQKIVQAITEGGGKATQVEAGLKHRDGSVVWISTNAFIRFGADGKPCYVEGIARDISIRKRMEDQLTLLSRTDELTDVYNRRHFIDKSKAVIELMKRYQRPASMMMLDLDHFKNINDQYGHHIGDLALIAFTRVCRKEIRESDILGRMGGEEFGLILPETPIQNAQALAERIRKATAAIVIPFNEQMIRITVSIGVVELDKEDLTFDSVMQRADQAMYQAKENGRDQVVTFIKPD